MNFVFSLFFYLIYPSPELIKDHYFTFYHKEMFYIIEKDSIHQTLDGMGFDDINEVRQGKYFEIDTKETDPKKAKDKVEDMCKKLLANLVIENFKIIDAQ